MNRSQLSKFLRTTTLAALGLFFLGSWSVSRSLAVLASDLRPEQVASTVYQRLDFLSLENNYLDLKTGEINDNHTLVNRLIRYHLYVKERSLKSRFDWKLTLADYLGYNEPFIPSRYPGNRTLAENPASGDRQVISNLTASQREQLVNALFSIYNPEGAKILETQSTFETRTNQPEAPENNKPRLHQPRSGDADLLKF